MGQPDDPAELFRIAQAIRRRGRVTEPWQELLEEIAERERQRMVGYNARRAAEHRQWLIEVEQRALRRQVRAAKRAAREEQERRQRLAGGVDVSMRTEGSQPPYYLGCGWQLLDALTVQADDDINADAFRRMRDAIYGQMFGPEDT